MSEQGLLSLAASTISSNSSTSSCSSRLISQTAEWHATLAVNLHQTATDRVGHKVMRKSGAPIMLKTTAAARVGLSKQETIAAVNNGVSGLMHSAAASCDSRGRRVNAEAPVLVKTT